MDVSVVVVEMDVSVGEAVEMDVSVGDEEMDMSVGADEAPAFEMDVSGAEADAPANGTGKLHAGAELRRAPSGETTASAGGAE